MSKGMRFTDELKGGQGHDKPDAQKPSFGCARGRCKHGDARGSEVSLCGFRKDQLVTTSGPTRHGEGAHSP